MFATGARVGFDMFDRGLSDLNASETNLDVRSLPGVPSAVPGRDEPLVRYFDADEAAADLLHRARRAGWSEFARVRNLDYVNARYELYPLAPHTPLPLERIRAFAVDMDGTSTTTEPLALHGLEYMVRRFTGRLLRTAWTGLDPVVDHPHVIGNSNFRHTEFLVERYRDAISPTALRDAFFEALLWTLANMDDPQRHHDVRQAARSCGLADLLADAQFQADVQQRLSDRELSDCARAWVLRAGDRFRCTTTTQLVDAALQVYYLRYHGLLQQIAAGEPLSADMFPEFVDREPIAPMPGYDLFLPLVKGMFADGDADVVFERLRAAYEQSGAVDGAPDVQRARVTRLIAYFRANPVAVALVTASIRYEAEACMKQVVRLIGERAQQWDVSSATRARIAEHFGRGLQVFDGFVHATLAHEARLKPHRDLYSMALFQMSIPVEDYGACVGLEDTEPGIVSLRAAGIGCAVALPNPDTRGQHYGAAARVVRYGLPELILDHQLFLADSSLNTLAYAGTPSVQGVS